MTFILKTIETIQNPSDYVLDSRLKLAVELAYALDKPLLVSGEPGTGKTQLAFHVAKELAMDKSIKTASFLDSPIVFHTKSSSSAMDLFYTYDAVSHFRSKPEENKKASDFIDFTALGRARVLAHGRRGLATHLKEQVQLGKANPQTWERIQPLLNRCIGLEEEPRSSVVLIDEIDKAPREFPNDLLNEMELGEFRVRELDFTLGKAKTEAKVLVILTSNFEKSLPNAFLRRCIFYHIPFPDRDTLLQIVANRLGIDKKTHALAAYTEDNPINKAYERFIKFREQAKQSSSRVPSTAEFLDWLRALKDFGLLNSNSFPPAVDSPYRLQYEASLLLIYKEGPLHLNNPQDQSSSLQILLA